MLHDELSNVHVNASHFCSLLKTAVAKGEHGLHFACIFVVV